MTITQTITALPAGPNPATDTRENFSTKAAARVLAEETLVTEINTWAGQANALAVVMASNTLQSAAAGGTVDAITATMPTTITALTDQLCVRIIVAGANTSTTPTFAPDGLTAHTITKLGGQALRAGDLPGTKAVALLEYDSTNSRWELLNPAYGAFNPAAPGTLGAFTMGGAISNPSNYAANFGTGAMTAGTSSLDGLTVGKGAGSVATNTTLGASANAANTTGANNTALGYQALNLNTTSGTNTAVGVTALGKLNTSGNTANTAIGTSSGREMTTGSENTHVGRSAGLQNQTGVQNTSLGVEALNGTASNSHNYNTAIGYRSGYSLTTGEYNTFVGWQSGGGNSLAITTASNNVAVGRDAGGRLTTGNSNVFLGQSAGRDVTTGGSNVIIGNYAGSAALTNNIVLADVVTGNPQLTWNGTSWSFASSVAVTGTLSATTTVSTGNYTVGTLPAGSAGMRAYVTDANATTFNSTVAAGGSNKLPVFYNGTNWTIG